MPAFFKVSSTEGQSVPQSNHPLAFHLPSSVTGVHGAGSLGKVATPYEVSEHPPGAPKKTHWELKHLSDAFTPGLRAACPRAQGPQQGEPHKSLGFMSGSQQTCYVSTSNRKIIKCWPLWAQQKMLLINRGTDERRHRLWSCGEWTDEVPSLGWGLGTRALHHLPTSSSLPLSRTISI